MIGDEELNPCRVCGHPAYIRGYIDTKLTGDAFQITCSNRAKCINDTKWFDTKEEAIEAWNAENDGTTSQCPFCGTPFDESRVSTVWIEVDYVAGYDCPGCYCQMIGNGRLTKEEAIADLKMRWNRRC